MGPLRRRSSQITLRTCFFCNCVDRNQESLWAAGWKYRQGISATTGKPQPDSCLVTVVNSLSLDDNKNCETSTVAINNNDNMACSLRVCFVLYRPIVLYRYYFCHK